LCPRLVPALLLPDPLTRGYGAAAAAAFFAFLLVLLVVLVGQGQENTAGDQQVENLHTAATRDSFSDIRDRQDKEAIFPNR
jgi:hypothetical protein